jgi:hypothetical protein
MKKIILIAFLCISFKLFAQDKLANPDQKNIAASGKSNFEKFAERTGSLEKKEYFDLEKIADIKFELIRLTDLNTDSVKFSLLLSGLSKTYNNCEVYLDQDEFEALDKTIGFMIEKVIPTSPNVEQVEYNFLSRSDFRFSTYNNNGFLTSKKKWHIWCTLDDAPLIRNYTNFEFDPEDLPKVKTLLSNVITRIATMK